MSAKLLIQSPQISRYLNKTNSRQEKWQGNLIVTMRELEEKPFPQR
jgi:hypothetical protein